MLTELLARIFELLKPADDRAELDAEVCELPWVLHIEDDAEFSNALKLRLEHHGVAVVRAFDGTSGYRSAFLRPADAILLDVELPNGCGDYVLERLKGNSATRDIPVIVVTGVVDRSMYRKMMNLGASAYLNKPLDFEELHAELGKYIDILPTVPSS